MSSPSRCPSCSSSLPDGSRFCGSCGQPVPPLSALPTAKLQPGAEPVPRRPGPSRYAPGKPRFLPGTQLAGRYRIVGLLGKGGMGEVYRADDLKLGQPVALKFLPRGFDANPGRLQRFLDEVRTARQVSHPNVCRIYDAGETDGQHFLSMEYIDGEDLGSLLRRIGHLPKDKAVQIARQLCAGLAASHEVGVLHRDLKPANIMIDGRGRARITDFGLAAFAGDIAGDEVLAGTPAYMAPEQLAGREVSVRSDLYSLGLVLYELFTGRPAFKAASVDERRRLQSETTPSTPSSLMEGFDPMVERVILRCLDPDPARRPSSALAIAAALPGGDPLAAALAAGETPSPELVAEAGGEGASSPWVSWAALTLLLVAMAAILALAPHTTLLGMVPLGKPPEFLQERAREILAQADADRKPADSLFAFEADRDYLEDLRHRDGAPDGRWNVLQSAPPGGIQFWYRESRRGLAPLNGAAVGNWLTDPPDTAPGMARVGLDPDGRLISLLIVPGEHVAPSPAEPDWAPLLQATGVDAKTLVPVAPEWAPPVFADRRAAWTGSWPGRQETPLRIEAAAADGKPVSLRVVLPWTRPAEEPVPQGGFWNQAARLLHAVWPVVVFVVAGFVALRNVRRARGDRRGALRIALYLGAARMSWFFGAHHMASSDESELFFAHFAFAMLLVGFVYVFYLAVEPYARRLWPRMLVSWVRVLEGRFGDPLVGRDLVIGSAAGALSALLRRLGIWIPAMLGGAPALPVWNSWSLEPLRGTAPALVTLAAVHTLALLEIFFPVTSILIFRLLLRRTSAALIAAGLVGTVLFYPDSGSIAGYLATSLLMFGIAWLVLFRAGLLAFAAMFTFYRLIDTIPLTPHPAAWFLGTTLISLAFLVAPALYGFWISRAGRPLFRDEVLEAPARR
ncbi:MAG TPA: serine/threonine-protein kinase [Thermoanaerobaculia bacterium]|nr:serine/threonine-protein kinase [Thermoanaerobaculia bacterium]